MRVSVSLTGLNLRTPRWSVNTGGKGHYKPAGQRWISYPRWLTSPPA
nr:MAG TPA: hypothetical protein [Caudoviricetes sp.]